VEVICHANKCLKNIITLLKKLLYYPQILGGNLPSEKVEKHQNFSQKAPALPSNIRLRSKYLHVLQSISAM